MTADAEPGTLVRRDLCARAAREIGEGEEETAT